MPFKGLINVSHHMWELSPKTPKFWGGKGFFSLNVFLNITRTTYQRGLNNSACLGDAHDVQSEILGVGHFRGQINDNLFQSGNPRPNSDLQKKHRNFSWEEIDEKL